MSFAGGKGQAGVYQRIINQMPPHTHYIEAFAGGGSILRLKRPALSSIAIDLDKDVLNQLHAPNLCRVHGDALHYLRIHTYEPGTLVYCDPPYVMSTRRNQRPLYRYEFSDDQHRELLRIVRTIPAMVMVSGYYSEIYAEALRDWRTITFQAVTRGGSLATEYLWCNFPEPQELHDYSFLGENFRERERIKRKVKRWQAKLEKMPMLERYALRSAIASLNDVGQE